MLKGIIGADMFVNLLLVFIITTGLLFMNTNRSETPPDIAQQERAFPKVDLQQGTSPASKEAAKEAVVISAKMNAAGIQYYVDGVSTSFNELPAKLGSGWNRAIKIRFDKKIEYGKYVEILDLCRRKGFTEIFNTYAFEGKEAS